MLSYFKIHNYKSILDLTVELAYSEGKAPNNWATSDKIAFVGDENTRRLVPCLAIFGPNASGKTNIFKALETFLMVIKNGLPTGSDNQDNSLFFYRMPRRVFFPNKLNNKYDTICFEIEFFIDQDVFTYTIEYTEKNIIKDQLLKNGKVIYQINNMELNTSNIENETYTRNTFLDYVNTDLSYEADNNNRLQYRPFLSLILKDNRLQGISDLFKVKKFFTENIRIVDDSSIEHRIQNSLEDLERFINKFDIDIKKISTNVKEHKLKIGQNTEVFKETVYRTLHKDISGHDVYFDMEKEESLGTNRLFFLLDNILSALNNGGVVVVDELDQSLHPVIVKNLVRLFKDRDYNKHGAQLIFTAHNTDILEDNLMRISEVAILTKNLKSGTIIKRLTDIKQEGMEIRNKYDLRQMYLDEAFGGIPYVYI